MYHVYKKTYAFNSPGSIEKARIEVIQVFTPYYIGKNGKEKAKIKVSKNLGNTVRSGTYEKQYHSILVEKVNLQDFENNYEQYRTKYEEYDQTVMEKIAREIITLIHQIVSR